MEAPLPWLRWFGGRDFERSHGWYHFQVHCSPRPDAVPGEHRYRHRMVIRWRFNLSWSFQ